MDSRKVFISSTTKDLAQYREEATELIKEVNEEFKGRFHLVVVHMDSLPIGGAAQTASNLSRGWIAKADWMVLIVGWNYGTTTTESENGEHISITEAEYREATAGPSPAQKRFVFLAGDTSDLEKAYRPLGREKTPLNYWNTAEAQREDPKGCASISRFRKDLRNNLANLFRDIDMFREQLKRELREAISTTLRVREGTTHILQAGLIVNLTNLQISFMKEIQTLANLKRIHDRLHRIRQFGIRRWREEVFFKDNESLPHKSEMTDQAKIVYYKGLGGVQKYRGLLEAHAGQLSSTHIDLKLALENDVIDFDFSASGDNSLPNKKVFETSTDMFATRVQFAFSLSNQAMQNSATNLRELRTTLERHMESDMERAPFSPTEKESLSREYKELIERHKALQSCLQSHNSWQQEHNRLEQIDSTRGSCCFKSDFDKLVKRLNEIKKLAGSATEHAANNSQPLGRKTLVEILQNHLAKLASTTYEDDATRESDYEAMRKAFDDLFFEIDVKTLESVEASEQQVEKHATALMQIKPQLQN